MKTIKDKEYSFNHFKKRLKERFNHDVTRSEYDFLCSIINGCYLVSTEVQKNDTQRIYDVGFQGILIRVVWSETRQCVTTVLPKGNKNDHI